MVVTRDVELRYRGFLASVMLEVAPGTYVSPFMNSGVRGRVWRVLEEWHNELGRGSISMICADRTKPSGILLRQLGTPPYDICDLDGVWLARRDLKETHTTAIR